MKTTYIVNDEIRYDEIMSSDVHDLRSKINELLQLLNLTDIALFSIAMSDIGLTVGSMTKCTRDGRKLTSIKFSNANSTFGGTLTIIPVDFDSEGNCKSVYNELIYTMLPHMRHLKLTRKTIASDDEVDLYQYVNRLANPFPTDIDNYLSFYEKCTAGSPMFHEISTDTWKAYQAYIKASLDKTSDEVGRPARQEKEILQEALTLSALVLNDTLSMDDVMKSLHCKYPEIGMEVGDKLFKFIETLGIDYRRT